MGRLNAICHVARSTQTFQSREGYHSHYSPHLLHLASRDRLQEYRAQLKLMREREQNTMHVDFAHLQSFDVVLAQAVADEHYRFEPFLRRAVQVMVEALEKDYLRDEGEMREFSVAFYNTGEVRRVRDLSMSNVGKLTSFCGTITRTSEVRPELLTGRFSCGACGMLSSPVEQQFKLTEPALCVHNGCGNTKLWKLESQRSRFGDWQRIRVQENADEIPPGELAVLHCPTVPLI